MRIPTDNNVTVCGQPYAVCIAETPEEAERLRKFMEEVNAPEPTPQYYTLKDSQGFPYLSKDIEAHLYNDPEDAIQTAKEWCYDENDNDYWVDVLKDGQPWQRVRVKHECNEYVTPVN